MSPGLGLKKALVSFTDKGFVLSRSEYGAIGY
jgi:hypothetical protein